MPISEKPFAGIARLDRAGGALAWAMSRYHSMFCIESTVDQSSRSMSIVVLSGSLRCAHASARFEGGRCLNPLGSRLAGPDLERIGAL